MNLRNLINTGMGKMLIIAMAFSLLLPVCLSLYDASTKRNSKIKAIVVSLYIVGMFYLTVFDRHIGENNLINLKLFWSYERIGIAQYRWQIYLNILLFFPLGSLLPWAFRHPFLKTIIIGIAMSALFEGLQYFLKLGMCELDDVLHNSLGTALGYGYWRIIKRMNFSNKDY